MIKTIEVLISVKFFVSDNKIFQHFIIENKKGSRKYLLDKRYTVYDKFKEKLKALSLANNSSFEFFDKREEEDRIVLEFKIVDDYEKPQNYYFVMPGFIPKSPGCEFCIHLKTNGVYYCDFKQKSMSERLKTCRFFKQKSDIIKT